MDDVLTLRDVERLRADRSAAARTSLARKLGNGYVARLFGRSERQIADDIVRVIARDVEIEVRKALAQTIATSADFPEDVAVRLAQDVIEVAEPILTQSDLLDDDILVKIVEAHTEEHRRAIASRRAVSEVVSDAIVTHGGESSVRQLVSNEAAKISEPTLGRAVDRFGRVASVTTQLAERDGLPLGVAERLVSLVSTRLVGRLGNAGKYADGLRRSVAEGAELLLGGGEAETLDVLALVDQLQAAGRLQPSLILRAGRAGDRALMQAAMSRLSGRKYSYVASAFADASSARRLMTEIGLVPKEIDGLMQFAGPVAA